MIFFSIKVVLVFLEFGADAFKSRAIIVICTRTSITSPKHISLCLLLNTDLVGLLPTVHSASRRNDVHTSHRFDEYGRPYYCHPLTDSLIRANKLVQILPTSSMFYSSFPLLTLHSLFRLIHFPSYNHHISLHFRRQDDTWLHPYFALYRLRTFVLITPRCHHFYIATLIMFLYHMLFKFSAICATAKVLIHKRVL